MISRIKSRLIGFLFAVLILSSCIEDLGIFDGNIPTLIVNGAITDVPGKHLIQLSISVPYNTRETYEEVNGASVQIIDSQGHVIDLEGRGNGQYLTPSDFFAEIGKAYQLKIKLNDGREYESTFQSTPVKVNLDQVTFEIRKEEVLSSDDVLFEEEMVAIFVDFCDVLEESNYYRWRFVETFEVYAPYGESNSSGGGGGFSRGCGSIYKNANCWARKYDNGFLKVEEDDLFDGLEMNSYYVYSIPIDRRFAIGNVVEVSQFGITEAAHAYWTEIITQQNNNGSIFETANYQIKGNVRSISDESELVLGFFEVTSLSVNRVYIDQTETNFVYEYQCAPNEIGCIPAGCFDCTEYSASSSTIKPDYWPR